MQQEKETAYAKYQELYKDTQNVSDIISAEEENLSTLYDGSARPVDERKIEFEV